LEFLTADGVRATINIDQYKKLENLVFFDRVNSIFVLRASTCIRENSATQVNGKTEIFRRQLVAAQNLQSAGVYRQACNTVLSVLERVTLIV
jgi:hypothetical protein